MKKFLFSFIVAFLLSFSYSSFAQQIILPDGPVCPNEVIEYEIQPSYYGHQTFRVINGVFIVADSLYYTPGDSTGIIMAVGSLNNKFKVKWNNDSDNGTIRWFDQSTSWIDQDFDILVNPPTAFLPGEDEKTVLSGPNTFQIELRSENDNYAYDAMYSSNISQIDYNKRSGGFGQVMIHKYILRITDNQNGWAAFRSQLAYPGDCGKYGVWDTVIVNRKLNPPTISGFGPICSNKVYSISSSDSQTETYTWTVTDGLKIYQNGQYITSYTGPETSVTIYKPSGSGSGNIKVKASASGYVDSDETVKQVWYGVPSPDEINYYNVGPYYPSQNKICLDFPNDGKALYNNPYAQITEYEWDALNWTIIQHPMVDFPQIAMEDVQITAQYGVGNTAYFTIRARNTCGWGEWKYPKLELQTVSCGMFMMTVSPNPADTYVNISFDKAGLSTEMQSDEPSKKHKISLKKTGTSNDEAINDYLIEILDKNGTVRKSIRSKSLNLNIDTRDLEPGTYFLHLSLNDELIKRQLIIE